MDELNFNIRAFVKPQTREEFMELLKEAHRAADELLASLKADTQYLSAKKS